MAQLVVPDIIELRASSLPAYFDCPRRAAARMFREQLKDVYNLAPGQPSVAAAIGTALHALAAELLRKKQLGVLDRDSIDEALEAVWDTFLIEIAQGVIWDKTTPHEDTAKEQLAAMARALLPSLEVIEPTLIEQEFTEVISPLGSEAIPLRVTGHVDVLDVSQHLWDHKTGARFPHPHAQLGMYAMLLEYADQEVRGVYINYIKRLGVTKLDECFAQTVKLPLDACRQAAWATLFEFQRHCMDFFETGNPWSFPANPVSQSCTEKYCLAYGTGFCEVGYISGCGNE